MSRIVTLPLHAGGRTQARRRTAGAPGGGLCAYAELQVASNFSFLRGASHADELVATAKALGLSAIAVTDRNSFAGIVRAHIAAKEIGLRFVVGVRLDLEDAPSLLCYPTDRAAYGRLCRLLSLGQGRAAKGRCSIRLADVAAHAESQIFIVVPPDDWNWRETAMPHAASEHTGFAAALDRVRTALAPQHWTPGASRLFLALTHRHHGDDRARITALADLARRARLSPVATGDVLHHAPHRRPLQDILTCVRHGTTIADAGLRLAANAERHLKSAREMQRLFDGFEDAVARTQEIVAACRFSLDELVYEYPDEPVPPGRTPQAHLEDLTWEGAKWRFPAGIPERIAEIIGREIALVAELGFAPYFLTVQDIVSFARSRGILCQGRGSAANSVICYCLGITAVDPTEVELLFERFVSVSRREPPDIDVDFEHERREEVIQYIYARYGRDRAGLAATVISYRARSAVRDVGKAMGLSENTVSALAGMVWGTRSGGVLPEQHVREAGLDPGDPRLARTLELARELVGFPRHLSQHVGGFVLTRGPLVEVVPIGNAAMADRTFIEWDKDDIAALGLLKIDVLALGMLSCIRRAFELLEQHHGRTMTLASVPREDGTVYDMLCRADSIGVFQVESRAQMNMLPRLRPRTFYDLVIEVAIVRPGPIQGGMVHPYLRRRQGLEPEDYPAPAPGHGLPDELRDILGKTKGVPLFQEQAMRIAMVAARFSDAEVNELRKAMATFRRRGTIGLLEEKMVSAMVARGYDPAFAARCFEQIKGFGEYGFPESHAASFAHLVYVSSWLKCHYPAAFCAAILNAQPMGFYAPAQLVRDAREHGVEIRPADVMHSAWDATLEPVAGFEPGNPRSAAVRLGLRQVDGLAREEVERIVAARRRLSHPPAAIEDLMRIAQVSRTTLERLAEADCFRSFQAELGSAKTGLDRRQALWQVKGLAKARPLPLFDWRGTRDNDGGTRTDRSGADGEGCVEPVVALPAMPLPEHVVNDYQTLRLSLKAHPMGFLRDRLEARQVVPCSALRGMRDGVTVTVAGVVLVRQRPGTAKGVVFMTIEDETGVANSVVWPKTLERYRKVVMGARLILIRGRIQRHEDIVHVVSNRLEDRSDWLLLLSEDADGLTLPVANADEVRRPDPGSARGVADQASPRRSAARRPRATHPRAERVIPKSRDFH